tara:strand:+ start:267 stop:629 length:363 start_codon:yes stop_codon:yes gene_type:complete
MLNLSEKYHREAGYGHWRWQRVSAVTTLIFMVYFTYLVVSLGPLNYEEALVFVATPHQAVALSILVIVGFFHAALGVQMIVEDYVPLVSGRLLLVSMVRGVFSAAALVSLVSVGLVAGWL